MTVSQTSLFFLTLAVSRSAGEVFYKLSLNLDLSEVFLMVRLELWVLKKYTLEVKIVFARFLHCKVTYFSPLHAVFFGSKSLSLAYIWDRRSED